MTTREWVQLIFAISNGISFTMTFQHKWWSKLIGSITLVLAHPMVAVYFLATGQPIFLIGNVIMTTGGVYGTWRALRQRAAARISEGERSMTNRVSECSDFDWDDVNVAQRRPEIEAVSNKLMDLYGEAGVYEDDRDLYSDATVLVRAHDEALGNDLPAL